MNIVTGVEAAAVEPAAKKKRRFWPSLRQLVGTAAVVIIFAQGGKACTGVTQEIMGLADVGAIRDSCTADMNGMQFFATNTSNARSWFECRKGTLTNKKTKEQIETLPLCTGLMEPHTSIELRAPFYGSALDVCRGENGFLDWSTCDLALASIK